MRKAILIVLLLVGLALAVFLTVMAVTAKAPGLRVGMTLDNPTIYFNALSEAYQKEHSQFTRHSVIGRDDRFVCRTEYRLRTNHVLVWRLQTYRLDTNDTVISSDVRWKWKGDF